MNAIQTNVQVFELLKKELQASNPAENALLQWAFSAFYGMTRVSPDKRFPLFQKMAEIKINSNDLDAKEITESLRLSMEKNYFSFVTKMLNLVDDEKYPIYDSHVAAIFEKPHVRGEDRLSHQMSVYQDIIELYKNLRDHTVISRFRAQFNCPDMGYMKILDSIFWVIGRNLLESDEE